MALERHIVELSARDTLSPALRKVGQEADRAGKQAEDASKRASRSMADWSRAASALGLAIGAGVGAAIKISNEAEVVQARLRQSIENTGAAYEDYADAIDAASDSALKLAFDDEDAANAIAALTDATGDAGKAINDLALAQDIARGRGIDLAAATNIVIAAETGRIQSLKRMGIELDASATSQEALAALQQKYAGQAEAYAQTNAATWDRMGNTIENTLESIGGHLADFQGPLVALSAGASLLGPLSDAFEALDGKAKLASLGSKALASSWIGPAGIVAAAGLAAVAVYKWSESLKETRVSADDVTEQVNNLSKALAGLGKAGVDTDILNILADTADDYERLGTLVNQYSTELGQVVARENELNLERANTGSIDRIKEIDAEVAQLEDRRKALEANVLTEQEYQDVQQNSIDLLTNLNGLNAQVVIDRYTELWQQFEQGTISADELAAGIKYLKDNADTYGLTLEQIANQQKITTDSTGALTAATYETTDAYKFASAEWKASVPVITSTTDAIEDQTEAVDAFSVSLFTATDAYKYWSTEQKASVPIISSVSEELVGANTGLQSQSALAGESTAAVADLDKQLDALADTLKTDLPGAASAAYNRVVGFTDGMVRSINTSKDWADALIAPVGTYSELDDMLARGQIDLEDYNEAQQAQVDITNDLARATAASNEIQVKQADTVADGAKATADYLEALADLPEAQQEVALAWADTDVAGQAMQVANLAAEFGNMNTAQQEAFSQMVTSAAATNPALAAVLEDLGLIKEDVNDPTGYTLTVPTDGAQASIQDVVDAIDRLTNAILGIPDAVVDVSADTTSFYNTIGGIPSIVGDRYINVHGVGFTMATGGAVGAGHLHALDTAALGRASAGNITMVGEHGPELVSLPQGAFVTPNHATRYDDRLKGGSSIVIQQMTVVANDPQTFMRRMRDYSSTMERR